MDRIAEAPQEKQETHVEISLWQDAYTGGMQLSIDEVDGNGSGGGYRIFGPTFLGQSRVVRRHRLTERDAEEIARYVAKVKDGAE